MVIAMRIKVEQTIVSNDDLKVVAAKKRKLYKTSATLKAKEVSFQQNYHKLYSFIEEVICHLLL